MPRHTWAFRKSHAFHLQRQSNDWDWELSPSNCSPKHSRDTRRRVCSSTDEKMNSTICKKAKHRSRRSEKNADVALFQEWRTIDSYEKPWSGIFQETPTKRIWWPRQPPTKVQVANSYEIDHFATPTKIYVIIVSSYAIWHILPTQRNLIKPTRLLHNWLSAEQFLSTNQLLRNCTWNFCTWTFCTWSFWIMAFRRSLSFVTVVVPFVRGRSTKTNRLKRRRHVVSNSEKYFAKLESAHLCPTSAGVLVCSRNNRYKIRQRWELGRSIRYYKEMTNISQSCDNDPATSFLLKRQLRIKDFPIFWG